MPRNASSPAICRQIALWVRASSSAALVKLWWRAAASKLIRAAVLGILRRMAGFLGPVGDAIGLLMRMLHMQLLDTG